MSDCMNKILQLLNDGRQKYDNPSMYQIYMHGILDTLNAVNDLLGSKKGPGAGEGEKPTSEKDEQETSLYYEPLSGRYFSMPAEDFNSVLNEVMTSGKKSMKVNEWFKMLGLEPLMLAAHYYWPIINGNFAYVATRASDKACELCMKIHYNNMPLLKAE